MIRRMILINSANFPLLDIDLSKDVFFLGDNASGKTTTTRAIHYLYNTEGRQLGIPSDKDSFEKYYFPYNNSYIVYVFDDFFIIAFKRSGKIQKWFSKQIFDFERVISNGDLLAHDAIRAYIKEVSSYHPQTNAEYRNIIYGQAKRYLDFSMATIKNYDAFLEVYNMVFNVDKAIVDVKSIKKAIQKSLQKNDEVLSLDFEQYIVDMTGFKRDYDFFKKFDKQRENIKKAVDTMEELISLENELQQLLGKIKYNQILDEEQIPLLEVEDTQKENKLKIFKRRGMHWENRLKKIINMLNDHIADLKVKIKELERLEEIYSPQNYEEKLLIASKKNGLEKEHDDLTVSIRKLEEQQSSIVKEIDNQIAGLKRKIEIDIPAEARQRYRGQKELEEKQCDGDIVEIESEFEQILLGIEEKIETFKVRLSSEENSIQDIKDKYEKEDEELRKKFEAVQEVNNEDQEKIAKEIREKEAHIEKRSRSVVKEEQTIISYKEVFQEKRYERAKKLNNERTHINQQIGEYQTLLEHEPNSFKEFLANEIDGWEETIYPVLDKSLLSKSCNILKPVLDNSERESIFGLKLDTTSLEMIPPADELIERVANLKEERKILLAKARDIDRNENAKLESFLNQIELKISNLNSEIGIEKNRVGEFQTELLKLKNYYTQAKKRFKENKEQLKQAFETQKSSYAERIKLLENERNEHKKEIQREEKQKKREITQRKEDLKFNLNAIKREIESEMSEQKQQIELEIKKLEAEKHSKTEDDLLDEYREKSTQLKEQLKECYAADKFLDEYDENRSKIENLPIRRKELLSTETFLSKVTNLINHSVKTTKEKYETLEKERKANSDELKNLKDGLSKLKELKIDFSDMETGEEKGELGLCLDQYISKNRIYKNQKINFKGLLSKLAALEYNAVIDINLNLEKFDEVVSMASLEHIKDSLEELYTFSTISYDNQKRSRHAAFTNYLNNIIPQKLGTFNDLEDRFEQQKNRINRHLTKADFGAIKEISLVMEKSKGNKNTIASLMRSLNSKVVGARTMFEDKQSLFFDKPKSIENIDAIIDTLGKIKKQSEGGAIHIFDTIDLSISYIENGVKKQGLSHLKNDSSSGGNILLKVAIAISILALFANKGDKDTPFFLIVDEISRLKHQNQDKLKQYINQHGFRTLFITPDPVYPDPKIAVYYMFGNSSDENGGLEIAQMNII